MNTTTEIVRTKKVLTTDDIIDELTKFATRDTVAVLTPEAETIYISHCWDITLGDFVLFHPKFEPFNHPTKEGGNMTQPVPVDKIPARTDISRMSKWNYLLDGRIYLHEWNNTLLQDSKKSQDRLRANVSTWAKANNGRTSVNKRDLGMYVQFTPNAPK